MTKERNNCVLVVDDEKMTIAMAVNALKNRYEVITAGSGEEGFKLLIENRSKINIVILDVVLPNMSGFDFMEKMKLNGLSRIPVIIMTADHDPKSEILALRMGAADFIRKPLYSEILGNRIQNVLMRNQMEYDSLTGIYNRRKTFDEIRDMVKNNEGKTFCFFRYDIDNFSLYNSSMGEAEGDRLLLYGTEFLKRASKDYELCVYGRVDADVFCICSLYDEQLLLQHMNQAIKYLEEYRNDYRLKASFGIYVFDNTDINIEKVYTKASLAAHTCKGIYNKNYAFYEEWMEENLSEEQEVVNEMFEALDKEQFVPYLQPKYDLESDEPCGAEALVRWIHPEKGMIYPSKFIPVFEKNGFIAKLDYYMWESVCKLLHKWISQDKKVFPISVNISRISMHNPQLNQVLLKLLEKYDLTSELLQLEITESAYMTDPDLMKQTIKSLQSEGFTILMDDFGSGYSSLNTLKDIDVDILKVDMKFLPQGDTIERSEKILSSVIRMAGWLGIPTIAEGVETEAQRDFLRAIGCDYVQGYFYARPLCIEDFEKLVEGNEPTLIKSSDVQHSTAAWSADDKVNEILAGIQLPIEIVEYSVSRVEVVRVNLYFENTFGKKYMDKMNSTEQERINRILAAAVKEGTAEGDFTYRLFSGKYKYYKMKVKRLEKTTSASLLCVIMVDITAEKLYGLQLMKLDKLIPTANRAKMLVVDDTKIMRDMINYLFSDTYDILEAENGRVGLEILNKEKDHLSVILLDMMMPVMNGRTFLTEKNKIDGYQNIPVIVMSSDSDTDLQLDMLSAGVNDYITKPFDNRIFKQKVDNAIMYAERFGKLRNEFNRILSEEVEIN